MRLKHLGAALAVCAVGVLGLGTAGASAATVTLTDKAGTALPVGSTIKGVSNNVTLQFSGGTAACYASKISGKVTANGGAAAAIAVNEASLEHCRLGYIPMEVDYFAIPGPVEFLPNNTVGKFPMELTWHYAFSPERKCVGKGSIGGNWSVYNDTTHFNAHGFLKTVGIWCPENQTVTTSYALSDQAGQQVKIVTTP